MRLCLVVWRDEQTCYCSTLSPPNNNDRVRSHQSSFRGQYSHDKGWLAEVCGHCTQQIHRTYVHAYVQTQRCTQAHTYLNYVYSSTPKLPKCPLAQPLHNPHSLCWVLCTTDTLHICNMHMFMYTHRAVFEYTHTCRRTHTQLMQIHISYTLSSSSDP